MMAWLLGKPNPSLVRTSNGNAPRGTTPNSYSRNGDIFTVGAAGVGGVPTVGVLGPSSLAAPTDVTIGAAGNLSRPYSWG